MIQEPVDLFNSVLESPDPTYRNLFLSDYTFADRLLASHYGAVVDSDDPLMLPFDNDARAGLLGTAGVLARYGGSQVYPWSPRWYWLLTDTLLCEAKSLSPPPGIPQSLPRDETIPLRQATEQATIHRGEDCAECHVIVNEYGYAFAHFDYMGRYTTHDGVAEIDSSGEVPEEIHGTQVVFDNQRDLVDQLTMFSDVGKCMTTQMLRYALRPHIPIDGRTLSAPELANRETIHDAFWASGGDLRVLVRAIVESPSFLLGVD
jgi:hypothetical protein